VAAYAYDMTAGVKLSTYAVNRIKWELTRYYERNGFAVRVPAYMKKRFRDCIEKKENFSAKIIDISCRTAEHSTENRQYHNLVVLRYLTDTLPSVQQICKALHIGRQKENYERITGYADRLLVLVFGVDGINRN